MPKTTKSNPARSRLATISLAGKTGKNSFKFAGKLSGGELKPGGYTVTITTKAANGQSSKPLSLRFTIVA